MSGPSSERSIATTVEAVCEQALEPDSDGESQSILDEMYVTKLAALDAELHAEENRWSYQMIRLEKLLVRQARGPAVSSYWLQRAVDKREIYRRLKENWIKGSLQYDLELVWNAWNLGDVMKTGNIRLDLENEYQRVQRVRYQSYKTNNKTKELGGGIYIYMYIYIYICVCVCHP